MMQPPKLLQDLCMIGVTVEHPSVCSLGGVELSNHQQMEVGRLGRERPYVFLLFVNMTNLEPDILFSQRSRRIVDNVFETLDSLASVFKCKTLGVWETNFQTLIELLLLFIDYAKTKVDLVCLLKVRLHAHDLRKRLLCVIERSVAVI
jgi:hypothetical protein